MPLPSIVLKFVAPHIRNAFYGLYLAKATKDPIQSEQINLPQGCIIRIGELLTTQNQSIFIEAIKLKRDRKVMKVNTLDGLIRVKATQTGKFVTIRSQRELDAYVLANPAPMDTVNRMSAADAAYNFNEEPNKAPKAPDEITESQTTQQERMHTDAND